VADAARRVRRVRASRDRQVTHAGGPLDGCPVGGLVVTEVDDVGVAPELRQLGADVGGQDPKELKGVDGRLLGPQSEQRLQEVVRRLVLGEVSAVRPVGARHLDHEADAAEAEGAAGPRLPHGVGPH
jgi:hypothetical protein